MPKIKFSLQELQRISLIIERDIRNKKSNIRNLKTQEWSDEDRQKRQIELSEKDFEFVVLIKEKIDSKTFGKNE